MLKKKINVKKVKIIILHNFQLIKIQTKMNHFNYAFEIVYYNFSLKI